MGLKKVIFIKEVSGVDVRYLANEVVEIGEGSANYFISVGLAKEIEKKEEVRQATRPQKKSHKGRR
jgi:hypothetical protein